MQRFQASVVDTITRYSKFDSLNSDALNYSTAWLWAVTPHLTGTLSADRTQSQVPFALAGGTQRNLLTTNNRNFTLDFTVSGAWHLLGGMGHSEVNTEIPTLTIPSSTSDRAEAGLRYVSRAGNSVTFLHRWIPANLTQQPLDPINLIDTNYRDTESELRGSWTLTGKSTVEARAVHKERVNLHFTQRNFSGVAGDLRYIWTPTGKTRLTLALTRDVLPYSAFGNTIENSTYRVDNTLSLLAAWQATAKITVIGNVGRTDSDFRGPVFPLTQPPREDTLTTASLSANWAIARTVSLNALLQHDQRSSNTPAFQFRNNLFLMGASLQF
jgi:exopolysaccharide biosynthesis operon protein EpsL